MNVSIISTYREKKAAEVQPRAKRLSRLLLEIAERNLECPESGHLISLNGIEKLKRKLAL
ncbi:MAG: hypothetical protein RLN88_11875 [Ekhidna sp.]|uniref:hypothetical protein n=1 Tax=Ekhidna sp. TaxID=2608089 RepID=UPI0032ED729D